MISFEIRPAELLALYGLLLNTRRLDQDAYGRYMCESKEGDDAPNDVETREAVHLEHLFNRVREVVVGGLLSLDDKGDASQAPRVGKAVGLKQKDLAEKRLQREQQKIDKLKVETKPSEYDKVYVGDSFPEEKIPTATYRSQPRQDVATVLDPSYDYCSDG